MIDASGLGEICRRSPRFDARWYEVPSEESAGVGLGLVMMSGISIAGAFLYRSRGAPSLGFVPKRWGLGIACLAAVLVPICLVSSEGLPRMIAVFIPPVLILVLLGAVNRRLVRSPSGVALQSQRLAFRFPELCFQLLAHYSRTV
jgi:hypothetical protein